MEQLHRGFFRVTNPYNQRTSVVPATADRVHSIVLWSKNFGPFIAGGFDVALLNAGYNLFFNYTVNSTDPLLEPNVPPLEERLHQLAYLCHRFGPESVNWRFDPICFYATSRGNTRNNLKDFSIIAKEAYRCDVKRCVTSFMDHYKKIQRRVAAFSGFSFFDPPLEQKIEIILGMVQILSTYQIRLQTCCEKEVLENLPPGSTVTGSACIPNDLLTELFGGYISLKSDSGQRVKEGCGCKTSIDIGSYRLHPCYHRCLFCYANPASGNTSVKLGTAGSNS